MIKGYEEFMESFSFEMTPTDRSEYAENNQMGFNDSEDALDELNWLLDNKYKDLDDQIYLYRLLFIEKDEEIDTSKLGDHWIIDPSIINHDFIKKIRETNDSPYIEPIVIKGLFNSKDLDWVNTLHNNMSYPNEEEVTTKSEPIKYEVLSLSQFSGINENLGFDLADQKYEIRFKKNTMVFATFINAQCGKEEYHGHNNEHPAKRRSNTSIKRDGNRNVDMEVFIEKGNRMVVNIDMIHSDGDNIDISGLSLSNILQFGDGFRGILDVREYATWIEYTTCDIILDPVTKNGSIISLSMDNIEIKGIHY
jgi:hypothetical protein